MSSKPVKIAGKKRSRSEREKETVAAFEEMMAAKAAEETFALQADDELFVVDTVGSKNLKAKALKLAEGRKDPVVSRAERELVSRILKTSDMGELKVKVERRQELDRRSKEKATLRKLGINAISSTAAILPKKDQP